MTTLPSPPQPKLLSWQLAAAVVALVAAAVSYATCDMALARWFSMVGLPGDLRRLVNASEVFAYGGGVICIALTATVLDRRGTKLGAWLVVYSLGAGLLADLSKLILARQRPFAADLLDSAFSTWGSWFPVFTMWNDYSAAWQSFPSGHTATAVGLAIGLSVAYPRGRWLFATFAVLAAMQRLQANAHFLSDVLAAAALALLWSLLLAHLPAMKKLLGSEEVPAAAIKPAS